MHAWNCGHALCSAYSLARWQGVALIAQLVQYTHMGTQCVSNGYQMPPQCSKDWAPPFVDKRASVSPLRSLQLLHLAAVMRTRKLWSGTDKLALKDVDSSVIPTQMLYACPTARLKLHWYGTGRVNRTTCMWDCASWLSQLLADTGGDVGWREANVA